MMKLFKKMSARWTLAQRIILFTQAVFIVLTLLIALSIGYTVYHDTRIQLVQQAESLNQQLAKRIDHDLLDRRDTLGPLAAQLTDGKQLKSLAELQHALDTRIKLHEFFNAGLVVVDLEGNLIADSPRVPSRVGLNIADRGYFTQLMAQPEPLITSTFIGRAVQEPVFHIYTPIWSDDQQLLGFVFGVTKLAQDNFLLGLSQEVLGDNHHFYVLDMNDELIVTASRRQLVLNSFEQVQGSGTLQKLIEGKRSGVAANRSGQPVMFTASELQEMDWLVVHTVATEEIFQPVKALLAKLAAFVLLLLILVVISMVWFIRRELTPLEEAADQVDLMVNAESAAKPIHVKREDELGRLLTAFNRLLAKQNTIMLELKQAKQVSDEANKTKSEFLANMSHEIRTPLNAVIGLTDMLLDDKSLPERAIKRIDQVHRSGQLLLGVINDVLDYSKIESGRLEVEKVDFKIHDVLEQLSVLFSEKAAQKKLELAFHVRPDVPTALMGDSLRLTQVLTNLISNAIKFTEQGEVELCIRAESQQQNQVELVFAIRDTGVGMTQEQRERLFNAFMQADTSITRKHGGTGLGLVISQQLVHLMGGSDIGVESEVGQGSVFSFKLTLPISAQAEKQAHSFDCDPAPCRALVVDDQPISRLILREVLESWQFEVDEAEDGVQALALVESHLEDDRFYRVILMDWEMPNMNGLSALRNIKSLYLSSGHEVDLPALLMVSAYSQADIHMGDDDDFPLLSKPFSPSGLYNAINGLQRLTHLGVVGDEDRVVFQGQSVLVVEDNDINREVIGEILAPFNIEVEFAEDGAQGVEAVRNGEFAVVLMDIQMPVMDGYQATKRIREFNQSLPIIALTAAAMVEDKQKALHAGMDAHLAKPIDRAELKRVMMQYLTWTSQSKPDSDTESVSVERALSEAAEALIDHPQQGDLNSKAEMVLKRAKPTILIVDDEPANAKILANGLKQDYRIKLANSGEKAFALVQQSPKPDLILLDIMMADMDGYQVCQALKNDADTQHIPIIFVTALDQRHDEEKGLNMGAVDYISKPFHLPIVKSRVRNHLALKLKTDLLEEMSHMDGLTHVANRRQFDETLSKESLRLARSGKPLGLIMVDIDFFKPFNDHYGHGQGDICLEKVAQALQSVIQRPGDLLARYGGEEFVVILPETDAQGTLKVAQALRQAVIDLQLMHEYSDVADYVTVSLGAVASQVNAQQDAKDLLKQADDALYQAKLKGRNQVFAG